MSETKKTSLAPDPFDPAALRLDQSFAAPDPFDEVLVPRDQSFAEAFTRKELLVIPDRKPNDQEWFRVHPTIHLEVFTFEDKIEVSGDQVRSGNRYLVTRRMQSLLASRVRTAILYPTITRQGQFLLWPVLQPGPDGKWNEFPRSAMIAAQRAMKEWVLMANIGKSYGVEPWPSTSVRLPDPEWPDLTPKQMLERCFGERVISSRLMKKGFSYVKEKHKSTLQKQNAILVPLASYIHTIVTEVSDQGRVFHQPASGKSSAALADSGAKGGRL